MADGLHWPLPDRPNHPVYANLLSSIASTQSERVRRLRFRAVCEADFWFFCRYASSFGAYTISDPSHPHHGKRWADEPWVFDRCRDIQQASDTGETGVFWNWPRYHFKTELLTKLHTIWVTLKDPSKTTAILTHKVDETGEAIFAGIRDELEKNKRIHEHWPDVVTPAVMKTWTKSSLTLVRPLGPREPSISLHSLDRLPTSMHVDWIKVDDAVVKETVASQLMIFKTRDWMRKVTPLGKDYSVKWWIGTLWDKDDPYMMALRDGTFTRRDHWSPFGRGPLWKGKPVLRSKRMLDEWRREMGDYDWSCQLVGDPVARGEQTFLEQWLTESRYSTPPHQERAGKRVYFIVDLAGGEGNYGADSTTLYVQGLGADRKRYSLEMYREPCGLTGMLDLLFEQVKKWRPEMVWVEEFGASGHVQTIKREMELRGYRFNVKKLPGLKRSKIDRIRMLQPVMKRHEILWPADGFGHGSKGDRRDTMDQFRSDEYRLWVPIEGATLHDDMLDSVAWTIQPEMKTRLTFPVDETAEEGYSHFSPDPFGSAGGGVDMAEVSPWLTM